jgi:hypothetical protein
MLEFFCFFSRPIAPGFPSPHVVFEEFIQHRENEMKQLFKLTAAPAAAFLALALASISTSAAAAKYEYCRTDVSSAMRSCSFTSLEQCQTMSAGRGGTCARDPFLPEASSVSNAFAQQPRGGLRHTKRPVQ